MKRPGLKYGNTLCMQHSRMPKNQVQQNVCLANGLPYVLAIAKNTAKAHATLRMPSSHGFVPGTVYFLSMPFRHYGNW